MTRWEYYEEERYPDAFCPTNEWLDQVGAEGWELVQIVGRTFYFKRPKPQELTAPEDVPAG